NRVSPALRMRAIAAQEERASGRDLTRALRAPDAIGKEPPRGAVERRERLLQIGDGADLHRVVAADLGRVDVDVHEARRREIERVLGLPGAAVGFGEARAEAENPVGRAALLVDEPGSPEAG